MTITVERQSDTHSPPGWAIYADLLPPEVLTTRRLKVVRRGVLSAVAAFVALLVLLYPVALYKQHAATSAFNAQQATQANLEASKATYSDVTGLTDQLSEVAQQEATLLAGDVALSSLLHSVRAAAPARATLTGLQLSIDPTGTASGVSSGAGSSLDTSGEAPIGIVTINGTASTFATASEYVAALTRLEGVIDVQPLTNSVTGHVFTFTIGLTVTNARLSNHYAVGGQ